MGLFNRNKFKKLESSEVAQAISQLIHDSNAIEDGLMEKKARISELMEKGKKETNREIKLFYAKKINMLENECKQDTQNATYILYNIQLLNKLKAAIDQNKFFQNTAKTSLNNLLGDQKGLAQFLNQTLQTRTRAEDVLTSADEMFAAVEDSYELNQTIYGVNKEDDALLAMFETAEAVDEDDEAAELLKRTTKKSDDDTE